MQSRGAEGPKAEASQSQVLGAGFFVDWNRLIEAMTCCSSARSNIPGSTDDNTSKLTTGTSGGWTQNGAPNASQFVSVPAAKRSTELAQRPAPEVALQASAPPAHQTVQFQAAPKNVNLCGVGVVFRDRKGVGLVVSSLAVGTPAYTDGRITKGDILLAIDGTDVAGMAATELGPLILGPPGTEVKLSFRRVTDGSGQVIVVSLIRSWAISNATTAELSNAVAGKVESGADVMIRQSKEV